MSYVRDGTHSRAALKKPLPRKILLIEDSVALSMLLKQRLESEAGAEVVRCANMASARELLRQSDFILGLTGLNLPDAPNGEILTLLSSYKVPTIVFTATFDRDARRRYAERKVIDYIVKNGRRTVDTVVATVERILTNRAFSILVVDDSLSSRTSLVDILERQNFTIQEAHSGKQALDILTRDSDIELVITDYHMPDMDGYELTRRIRDSYSSEDIRIIGVSSSDDRLLSASFLKAGASDFIYRPFVPEELQCRVDNNIETLKQLKRLRQLAERDHLTGLPNRRSFFERTRGLMEELKTGNGRGAIAVLDIDHFKKINDTLGHDGGDRTLKMVADMMLVMCEEDHHLAARLGGEEFAIFLRDVDARQAFDFCETLRARIAANGRGLGGSDIDLTASFGVVEIEKDEPFDNQLFAADQFLYMAKNNGRNRVYSDLIIQSELAQISRRA